MFHVLTEYETTTQQHTAFHVTLVQPGQKTDICLIACLRLSYQSYLHVHRFYLAVILVVYTS